MTPRDPFWMVVKPPVVMLLAASAAAVVHRLLPHHELLGATWRGLGVPVIAAGMALILWPAGLFRKSRTTILPHDKPSVLITRGPYKVTRNPIYLGMTLILTGCAIVMDSVPGLLAPSLFLITIAKVFIPYEEHMLAKRFGKSWHAYQGHVPRWLL